MANTNPRGPAQPIGKAVDDEDPDKSPMDDRKGRKAGEPRGAAEQAEKDSARTGKPSPKPKGQ